MLQMPQTHAAWKMRTRSNRARVPAGSQSSQGGVLIEEVALGRMRRYRQDAQNDDVMVIEDSQVRACVLCNPASTLCLLVCIAKACTGMLSYNL